MDIRQGRCGKFKKIITFYKTIMAILENKKKYKIQPSLDDRSGYVRGGSQISEPEIVKNPYQQPSTYVYEALKLEDFEIKNGKDPKTNELETKPIQLEIKPVPLETQNTTTSINEPSIKPNNQAVPSATTEQTKTYVSGGTTPNSTIIVNKSKPSYLSIGVLGLIGIVVVYKVLVKSK
jgi:hypothetical protein